MADSKLPEFIQRMKAKLLIKDELQKLENLSDKLLAGRIEESDATLWKETLKQVEDYINHITNYDKDYKKYKMQYEWFQHRIRVKRMKEYAGPLLITSSLLGVFDSFEIQREKHQNNGDVVVVMGDWMSFEGDYISIHKAMDLVEEGVIFLRGKNEEKFIEESDGASEEVNFLLSLPSDVQTESLVITTGNSENEPIQMKDFIEGDAPNLTGKTIITVHPIEGEDSTQDTDKNIILLAPGDAIKLNLTQKERNAASREVRDSSSKTEEVKQEKDTEKEDKVSEPSDDVSDKDKFDELDLSKESEKI